MRPDRGRSGPDAKPAAHAGAAGDKAKARNDTAKPTDDPRAFQGIANARSPAQRPPRWSPPRGADALRELGRLFAPPPQWAAIVTKANGARVIFSLFEREADAVALCGRLLGFGLSASVERCNVPDARPGMTMGESPAR